MFWKDIIAFALALVKDLTLLLTSGFLIALVTAADFVGHPLPQWLKQWITPLLLLVAAFRLWQKERRQHLALQEKLSSFPRLRIAAVEVGTMWGDYRDGVLTKAGAKNSVIWLHLKNEPSNNTSDSVAERVRATVKFFDARGKKLCEMAGRWSHTKQPPNRDASDDPNRFLAVDFEVGETRSLDIAFKQLGRIGCFGFNNESYGFENFENPALRLPIGTIVTNVELVGVRVKSKVHLQFLSPDGHGELRVLKCDIQNEF